LPFAAWFHADDLTGTQSGIIFTGFAVIVFLWIYVRTARSFRKAASERLERLRQTLDPYCRAAGMLSGDADPAPDEAEQEPESLHLLLQQCKAAPLVTTEMIEVIDAYVRERDASRHAQLERLLDREIKRKIAEQASIIRSLDNPGWGTAFWKLVRPAVPFFLLAFVVYWSVRLYGQFHEQRIPALSWTGAELWMRYISCLAAVVSFHFAVMTPRKDSPKYGYRVLALCISAAAAAHLAGLQAAPYILSVQIVLFLCGFGMGPKRSRRDRPYAGSTDLFEHNDSKRQDK